jgi:hypothetical protein
MKSCRHKGCNAIAIRQLVGDYASASDLTDIIRQAGDTEVFQQIADALDKHISISVFVIDETLFM